MKKGFLIILSLLVFGLAFVYAQDLDVQLYEKIIIENSYGEFEIDLDFAIVRQKGVVSKLKVFSGSRIGIETTPDFVYLYDSKYGYFSFFASILTPPPIHPKYYKESDEIVYFVDSRGKKVKVRLSIQTKKYRDIPLKKLEKWQILLKQAYNDEAPVIITGETVSLEYTGISYILIIDVWNVYKNQQTSGEK